MKAILFEQPRKIRLIDDAPPPVPGEGEVLVRCDYVALCGTNMGPYLGDGRWGQVEWPPAPGWLGHENIGRVVESRCDAWPVGTPVLAHPDDYNGFAELIASKPAGLARLPDGLEDYAAMVVAQPLATVLRAMERVHLSEIINRRTAVVGQGPMGLIFTHLLGRMGAAEVIAIDTVAWRLKWAERFGATRVIDAGKVDAVEAVKELTGGAMIDLCVEAVGHPDALMTAAMLPKRLGTLYVFGVPHHDTQQFPWWHSVTNETKILTRMGPECMEYFQTAVDMIVQGRVDLTDMVTPRLPWEKAAEAFEMYAHPAEHEGSLKLTLVL